MFSCEWQAATRKTTPILHIGCVRRAERICARLAEVHVRWLSFLLAVAVLSVGGAAWAQAPDCSNPQAAAANLFTWQTDEQYDPAKAAACMNVPAGRSGERLAVQLKQVLDARGIYVPVSSLPTLPTFTNEDGTSTVTPVDTFPAFTLRRSDDGRWLISEETVRLVPRWYGETFSAWSLWLQNRFPPALFSRFAGVFVWQMLYAAALLLAAWTVGTLLRLVLRNQVERSLLRANIKLDRDKYRKTNGPVVAFAFFAVLRWGLPDLQLGIAWSAPLITICNLGMWIAGLSAFYRFIAIGATVAASWADTTESKLDDQAIPLLQQAAQLLVIVMGGLYLVDAAGFDVWKLAAGVGIGGLAFALAAQDTVANVFGSINIFLDRPFQIGDWVKVGPVEGVVEEVGFRSTRVRTFYNSLVTIPNSKITNTNVDNLGVRPRRRIKMAIGLTYDTPPDKLAAYVEGVRAILAAHPAVQRSYEVHLHNLGASAIEILVYYHVITADWHDELDARAQNLLEFMRLAETLDVSFAFPTQTLHVASTPDRPQVPPDQPSLEQLRETFDSFGPSGGRARPTGPDFGRSWTVPARKSRGDE